MSRRFPSFLAGVSRVFWCLLLATMLGCAKSAYYETVLPPDANVGDIERIAVAEFDGLDRTGQIVALQLSEGIVDGGFYRLFERDQLDRILEEHDLNQSGVVDPATVAELRLMGVDALVFGIVDAYNIDQQTGTTRVERQVDTGRTREVERTNGEGEIEIVEETIYETVEWNRPYILREGTMAVTFRLANISTGEIVAIKTETAHFSEQAWEDESEDLPTRDEVIDLLAHEVSHRFLNQIHPRTLAHRVVFEKNDAYGTEIGISYAQAGLWKDAYVSLQQAASASPRNPSTHYNEALAAMVLGYDTEAAEAARRAISIEPKDKYIQLLARIRNGEYAR